MQLISIHLKAEESEKELALGKEKDQESPLEKELALGKET
jgi:hypothetical protein